MADPIQLVAAYKIIKYLTTPFEEWDAYKLGLIDKNGKRLKKSTTQEERDALPPLARVALNIKRLLAKIPGGSSKIGSIAAALFLLKEQTDISSETFAFILEKVGALSYLQNKESAPLIAEGNQLLFVGKTIVKNIQQTDETFLGYPVFVGYDISKGKNIRFIGETDEEII